MRRVHMKMMHATSTVITVMSNVYRPQRSAVGTPGAAPYDVLRRAGLSQMV